MNLSLKSVMGKFSIISIVFFGIFLAMKAATIRKVETNEIKYERVQLQNQKESGLQQLPLFSSIFSPGKTDQELLLDKDFWSVSEEVEIAKKCKDGDPVLTKAFVRTRWDSDNLYFYAELEEDTAANDDTQLWNGSNLELLISPSGAIVPLVDEYEFLFNSNGSVNTLRWYNKSDLETSFRWQGDGLEHSILEKPLFRQDIVGYAIVIKMPFAMFDQKSPAFGQSWRLGLYRKIQSETKTELLAWSPTLTDPVRFHTPVKFGHLMFMENKNIER